MRYGKCYILPISKVRNPQEPSDNRPISNLSSLEKIMQRTMVDHILKT